MPRKREQLVYKYSELSSEAKERALAQYQEDMFDADNLTDQLKSILTERGFEDGVQVCWSLGYCQGDGVAFWGHINVSTFFAWAIEGDHPDYKKRMRKTSLREFLSLKQYVSVKVTHEGRECHWNSMGVLVGVDGSPLDLVPNANRDEVWRAFEQRKTIFREWEDAKFRAEAERIRPQREWQRKKTDMPKGPKEWRPLGPMPPRAEVPEPVLSYPEIPAHISRMMEKAEQRWKEIEDLAGNFEKFMEEWVKETSRELEKLGYDEIEYQSSEDNLKEFFEANDIEFDKEGRTV